MTKTTTPTLYHPALVGLAQAAGIIIYVFAIFTLMMGMEEVLESQSEILAAAFFLILFVTSATLTASMMFAYPIYLALQKHYVHGVKTVVATTLFLLLSLVLILFLA